MTFCSWYLNDMDTKLNQLEKNVDTCLTEAMCKDERQQHSWIENT